MLGFNHRDGRHISIDGAEIYYEIQGNAAGAPIVFLHGGFGSIEDFNALLPGLGQTCRLIGIDSRGQGRSTLGSETLTYRRLQQDAEQVMRHLGLEAPTIIGHSDGGIATLRIAAGNALKLTRIVTIGAHWALAADDPTREMYAGVTPESWREMFPESYAAYQKHNPSPDFAALTQALLGLWLDSGEDGYPNEAVRNIRCATLVIRGDEDPLVSRTNAVELADRVANAKLLNLPFAGHCVHDEQPEPVLWALKAFFTPA
ncbi:alpha/beta fold hydrolase [Solidesulfovibrio sp.]